MNYDSLTYRLQEHEAQHSVLKKTGTVIGKMWLYKTQMSV